MLDQAFTGPSFTVGIEEELMILQPEGYALAQAIEDLLAAVPAEIEGQVKPELMQSVLEIATKPCANLTGAAREITELRRAVIDIASGCGLLIGAAGTHPFARWEDQLIVDRERYHRLVDELGYVARQELIFGTHVHVGMEGADRAVYVADGIRFAIPLLMALSANSPFWRGQPTGAASSRTPIFRAFPRVGVPPHYGDWKTYSERVELMVRSGAIEDYTFLWWDVRPHPNLGTVEVRVYDQQTRVEHTIGFAALTAALAHYLSEQFDAGEPRIDYPSELIDDNKVRAALVGLEGDLVDFARGGPRPARDLARELLDALAPSVAALGCEAEIAHVEDLLENGNGATRQLALFERRPDLDELMREIVEHTRA
jgi:carboxylate-amine ligase